MAPLIPLVAAAGSAAAGSAAAAGTAAAGTAAATAASGFTLANALTVAGLAGTALGAIGQIQSGRQQQAMAEYNARVAEEEARNVERSAGWEEQQFRHRVEKLQGAQRSLYGKAGVTTAGSPLSVMEETAEQAELDALAIRYGGEVGAARSRSAAQLERMYGREKKTAGWIGAGTSLLTGTSQFLSARRGYVT